MPYMTGGDAIVDSLLRHGIDTIFESVLTPSASDADAIPPATSP